MAKQRAFQRSEKKLTDLFDRLQEGNPRQRALACEELRRHGEQRAAELPANVFSDFVQKLFLELVLSLLKKCEHQSMVAGILAMDAMVDVVAAENQRLLVYAKGLARSLPAKKDAALR